MRVTKFGKPIAKVVPSKPERKKSWLGCMRDMTEVVGDIVGPVGAFEGLEKPRRRFQKIEESF